MANFKIFKPFHSSECFALIGRVFGVDWKSQFMDVTLKRLGAVGIMLW